MAKTNSTAPAEPADVSAALAEPAAIAFGKGNLLKFQQYAHRADLLGVLLKDGACYTIAEVDSILDRFMKGQVN